MKKNPNILNSIIPYVLENPVGIDIIIKDLQSSFQNDLSWNNTSFNRAETMTRIKQDDSEEVFPKLWVEGSKDEVNAIGLDKFESYSFFHTVSNSILFGDFQLEGNRYAQDFNAYFWFDLYRIDPSKTYDYTNELVEEIKQVINLTYCDYGEFRINNVVDNPLDVYSDFSIDIIKKQNIHHPYRAIKFELEAIYFDVKCT